MEIRLAALNTAACVLLGCAPVATDGRSGSYTTRDSAGVQIITNTALSSEAGGWVLDSIPMTVVGRNALDTTQQFRRMPLAVRLANGHIVTAEDGVITAFDSTGAFVQTIARRGRGPGEVESVSRMIVGPGDTLVVRGGKILKYASGDRITFISDERLTCPSAPRLWHGSLLCANEFFADGFAVTVAADSTIPITATNRRDFVTADGFTTAGPGHLRQLGRIYLIPPARDTAFPTGLWAGIESFGIAKGNGHTEFVMHPFYSRSSFHSSNGSPRRLAVALNPEYTVEVWNEKGALELVVRRANARRVPTAVEHDEARKFLESYLDGSPITPARALAEMTIPDSLPAIAGLLVGAGGELLVQRAGWYAADSQSVFDVFDDRGVWVAEWKIPRRARAIAMGIDYVLFTRLDDDDVPLVEVRRFRRGGRGGGI